MISYDEGVISGLVNFRHEKRRQWRGSRRVLFVLTFLSVVTVCTCTIRS